MSNLFNNKISSYIDRYSKYKRTEEISIRDIVQNLKPDRATHMIHPYPAKLLLHIPYFFLNNTKLSKEGDNVLDPFCGSGTVLLESQLSNRHSLGIDTNPLANIIAETKVERYQIHKLIENKEFLKKEIKNHDSFDKIKFEGVSFWYSDRIRRNLSKIFHSINLIESVKYRKFFLMCFSNLSRKVSFADPKVSVPVKLDLERYDKRTKLYRIIEKRVNYVDTVAVKKKFLEIVEQNISRVTDKNNLSKGSCPSTVINGDIRNLIVNNNSKAKRKQSVELIITSPPYAGAQKYIRASKLNLSWLGLAKNGTLKSLDAMTIGRENYLNKEYIKFKETGLTAADTTLRKIHKLNPLRAHITSNYLIEMKCALTNAVKLLQDGGHLVLVVGNNNICGVEFNTQKYLTMILNELGLELIFKLVDNIKSYGLMTKRNKTADIINREWILTFKK